jgi:hypothetical protein
MERDRAVLKDVAARYTYREQVVARSGRVCDSSEPDKDVAGRQVRLCEKIPKIESTLGGREF